MNEAQTSQNDPRVRADHERFVWAHLVNALIGLWLLASPMTLGYTGTAIAWSDLVTAAVVVVFALLSVSLRYWWAPWGVCLAGVWLLFAPLVFWTSHPGAYVNSTAAGILLIAFSVTVPRNIWQAPPEPEVPPGWSFNPSSWLQRLPIVGLAWLSFFMSRYLAAYHLGFIDRAWDPFFGDGTEQILESDVSEAFPISDAGLGAIAYALEGLIGCMAAATRWRSAPWVVALFGVLVVPAGITSIVLIILQPVVVGAWCTLCLVAAALMLAMACLALPEVVAMVQFLIHRHRAGDSLWHTFWRGGPAEPTGHEPPQPGVLAPMRQAFAGMVWGSTLTWSLVLSVLLGVWLLVTPAVLGFEGAAADSYHVVGAVVVTIAALAMAEVARVLRLLNILLGLWIVATPFVLDGATSAAQWNGVIAGVLLMLLSVPRGRITQRYGDWERWIV